MPKIRLDYSDGRYFTRPLTDEEAAKHEAQGLDVTYIHDDVWEEYRRHCGHDGIWQALWRSISNEQYVRRRERELMPLEDAQREIARLKEDLARAKRMEAFYEDQYTSNLRAQRIHGHVTPDEHPGFTCVGRLYCPWGDEEKHAAFTCVYPKPGCQISALPSEWRAHAQEILDVEQIEQILDVENSPKRLTCCCGGTHKKLDEATAEQLRVAGFFVDNAAEDA